MVQSMTGYGKAVEHLEGQTITVEMKAINHRFLDLSFKMPRSLFVLEDQMKRVLKRYFQRGKIEVYINRSGQGSIHKNLQVDRALLDQYMTQLQDLKETYSMKGDIHVDSILTLSDIFEVEESEELDDTMKDTFLVAFENAALKLQQMREKEGAFLFEDLKERLHHMASLINRLEAIQSTVALDYQERLKKRIKTYMDDPSQLDEVRLYQELAIIVEKGDITEEIVRLKSHVQHMNNILNEKGSIGRKLDFICQEMHREANTIGSKSNDQVLSEIDVLLKSEIEKMKEQVQNIE